MDSIGETIIAGLVVLFVLGVVIGGLVVGIAWWWFR